MRKQLLGTCMLFGTCIALTAQSQAPQTPSQGGASTTYPSSPTPSTAPGITPSTSSSGSQAGWGTGHMSPTGRMHHEAVRTSQLTGAPITGTTGSEIGTISDTIVNPSLGRLEFAVISLNNTPTASITSSTPGATPSTGITSSASDVGGKQVAVPWMLLRPAASSTASTKVGGLNSQQASFTFMGDTSKLESAPNFDASTDLSTPSWRQSVFSYFGLSGRSSATGGAESPGGTTSSGSTFPGSSQDKP